MKKLLTILTMLLTVIYVMAADRIGLDAMPDGWESSYDAATKTITFDGSWKARGWGIWDNSYNKIKKFVVKFDAPLTYAVNFKLDYKYTDANDNNQEKETSAETSASVGNTEVSVTVPTTLNTIQRIYLTTENANTLKITDAYAILAENEEISTTYTLSDIGLDHHKRLIATFTNEAEVTLIAHYSDGSFSSITKGRDDGSTNPFDVVLALDYEKTLSSVDIIKTSAGSITLSSLSISNTNVANNSDIFDANGKADLTRFTVQDVASHYNVDTNVLTTQTGWTGIQIWPESENITGKKELNVKFAEAATVKIEVSYVGEGSASLIMSEATKEVKLMLDNTKTIKSVAIQPTTATAITLSEVALNAECTAYENEKELLNPSEKPTISHDTNAQTIDYWKFGNATEGDKIIVYISSVTTETSGDNSGKAKLTMSAAAQRPSLGSTWGGYADKEFTANSTDLQEIIYNLTGDNLTNVKNQGFYVNAAYGSFQLEKITMISSNDIPSSEPSYTLTKNVTPAAGGSIQVQTIVGEVATNTDETSFASGTNLKLTATPATGYDFSGWTIGDDSQSDNPYTFSINSDITATATFTAIPAFSLDNFEADEGNTYDKTNHILTNANAWSGGQLWIGNNSTYSGSTLVVRTSAASKLKIIVGYTDSSSSNAELSDSESSTLYAVSLDSSKKIQKVIIQNKEAGMVTFTEMSLDPSYTLTITQPANGTIMNGESNAVTGTHNYGTELTLTAVPSDTYELSKWSDGTNDLVAESDGSLKVTMDGDKSVTAVFGKVRTTKDLSKGSTKINGSTSVVIHKGMFANASVGDVITINISSISTPSGKENPGYAIKGAGEDETENSSYNWKWIEGGSLANNATSIIRTITSDDLVTLKASGLSIEGDGIYVCGDVTLTTNGEVPEAQTHSNPSFTLTVNDPIGGTIAIKKDSETVSAGAFDIDTELTLTATAANGYTFLKWQKNGVDAGTDATLSVTMSADTEITALFQGAPLEYEEKRTLFEGSVDINWSGVAIQPSTVGAILEAGEQLILTTTVAEGAYGQVVIRGADRSDAIEGSAIGGLVNGENVITLTSAMVEAMREEFGFWGADATLTKVVLYKPITVFSEAGVADLTTMTESEGKSTLAVPHEESLKGNVLVVESTEDATVTVTYTDNTTATNKAGNRKVGTPAASQALVSLDANKYIAKIEVNKAKSVISKIYTATLPVFETDGDNYAADLALATADAGVLYDTSSFTIAVSSGWKGISLTSTESETVKGAEISLTFGSEAKVKTTAYYTDGTDTGETGIMSEAATIQKLAIDNTKTIKSISIQPQEAGAVQLKEVKVNAEVDVQKYTLTLSTPENGTVVIKKGNEEVKAGEFDENTELTLTATAAEGYEFTKWQKNGEDAGTEATLTVKMTADMTIAAVFSKKTEPIIDEETGETDLTEMTPQDPSTTSVEYNEEDQSITITTTEPYKAAQIWFNEPEKLAKGNVLIVDIAESGVNVTVTVKYTDGTESSMTSTAHATSSRHASAAGTKISVPLETGKDVQNIEVKNAEAGTITIQKMVVTTKNIFTDGVADLSMAKPQSNAIYDTSTYSLAVTKGWTGITISPLANEQVSGVELMLQFTSAAQVKVAVTYNEGEGPSVIMDEAAKYLQMTLDKTKTVKEIQIQPTTAGVIQLKSLAVNQTETENPDPDYLAPLEYGERRTLFESTEGTQLSWNDICQMAANYGAILEEREQIEVYISARVEGCDWPKVFIKDAAGAECGSVLELNSVNQFPYMAKFKLNSAMAEQLSNGFSISGDGIIVTKVCLYKPEALKPGDIDIADLNGGYQSSYDATSKTITTTSRWAARGWDIGDGRYNGYDVIVVEFEAVDFPVTLRMEYVDADGATKTLSQGASAGSSQVAVEIPDNIQQINYVYLMYENPGTLILLNADVLTGTYIQTVKTGGNSQWDDGEAWYRLDGKRVSQPGRGIYIHNGKKIVIK